MLQFAQPPGFTDIPDSVLAAGQYASGFLLSAIKDNASFGSLAIEMETAIYTNGQTVAPFQSQSDGYTYQQSEVIYLWEPLSTSTLPSGNPSGSGGLLAAVWNVDQATGLVTCFTDYEVEGGATAPTTDGVLAVTAIGIRGRLIRAMTAQPSYTDFAASGLAQDAALTQELLQWLSDNAKFSTVRCEAFIMNPSNAPVWQPNTVYAAGALAQPSAKYANACWYICALAGTSGTVEPGPWPSTPHTTQAIDDGTVVWNLAGYGFTYGQEIPLPTSGVDGYEYSQAEIAVAIPYWITTEAAPQQSGINIDFTSGQGNILRLQKSVVLTQGVLPTASAVVSGVPYNPNASGLMATLAPTAQMWSPYFQPSPAQALMSTIAAQGTVSVNVGYLSCSVTYENGPFHDGTCGVILLCQRKLPVSVPNFSGSELTDFSLQEVMSGAFATSTVLQQIKQNADFSTLRPEIFAASYAGGQNVPLPKSSVDSYQYSQGEIQYHACVTDTGAPSGRLRDYVANVEQSTGVVETRTDYYRGGYKDGYGSIGSNVQGFPGSPIYSNLAAHSDGIPTVLVVQIASRQRELELQQLTVLNSAANTQPASPSASNLIVNGDMEIWASMPSAAVAYAGVADDWGSSSSGTTAFLQETGLQGNYAQGIGCQVSGATLAAREENPPPGGVSQARLFSMTDPVWPGGQYAIKWLAKASPDPILYGYYARVHILAATANSEPDYSTDTTFELLGTVSAQPGVSVGQNPGASLGTSPAQGTQFNFTFIVPEPGATTAACSSGTSVLSQTIEFTPAYLYFEICNWAPVDASYPGTQQGYRLIDFVIVDSVDLVDMTEGVNIVTPSASGGNTLLPTVGISSGSPVSAPSFSSTGPITSAVNTVAYSATPTFNCALGNFQTMTLSGNASGAVTGMAAGQYVVFDLVQSSAGGNTFAWPSNVHGGGTISATADAHNVQQFYCPDGVNLWAVSAMQST